VRGPNVAPELAPELLELFQSQQLQGVTSGDGDGVIVRNLLDDAGDAVVGSVVDTAAPPLGSPVYALMSCSACPSGLTELANNVEESDIGGAGRGRYIESVTLPEAGLLAGLPGKTPADMGYYAFFSGGEIVSQVHWGRWLEEDYEYSNEPGFGSWQYIFADNVVVSPESIGLTGSYRYSLVASSPFRGTDFDGQAISNTLNKTSYVDVDFGSFSASALLNFNNGDSLSGSGLLEELYNFGLALYGTGNDSMMYGSLEGAFVGGNAEGLISLIDYCSMTYECYFGSAVFQQGGPPPSPVFGGVSAFSTISPSKGVLDSAQLELGISGIDKFPVYAQIDTGVLYELIGNSTQPTSPVSSHTILDANDNILVSVYWGLWDQNSYLINEISEGPSPEIPGSDWHFMIADKPLSESMVASIGLTGVYTYFHVGGTDLVDVNGIDPNPGIIRSGSTVSVDFDNLMLSNAVEVLLDVNVLNYSGFMSGFGSLSDLYSAAGIGLTDSIDPMAGGSLSGTFAGAGAEALLGAVTVDYNTESYIGTVLFEKDPFLVPQ
jgi:hypothetical protein